MRPVGARALPRPRPVSTLPRRQRTIEHPSSGRSRSRVHGVSGAPQRRAAEDVVLGDLHAFAGRTRAGTSRSSDHAGDDRRARGRDAGPAPRGARRSGSAARRASSALELRDASATWPWTFAGVVRLELEVDRRGRRRRARHGDRAASTRSRTSAGTDSRDDRARPRAASASSSSGVRRVVVQVALGLADDAGLHRDEERRPRRRGRRRARSSRRRCRRRRSRRRRRRGRARSSRRGTSAAPPPRPGSSRASRP